MSFLIQITDNFWIRPWRNILLIILVMVTIILLSIYLYLLIRRNYYFRLQPDGMTDNNVKSNSMMSYFDEIEDPDQLVIIDETTALLIDKALVQARDNKKVIASGVAATGRPGVIDGEVTTLLCYFQAEDLQHDPSLAQHFPRKFNEILSTGIHVDLHTTKGPRPILLTIYNDEIRWQAVKSSNKKYKLRFDEIIRIEPGKKSNSFTRSRSTISDELCFSFITNKSSVDIAVNSQVDRDSLVLGFQMKIAIDVDDEDGYEII